MKITILILALCLTFSTYAQNTRKEDPDQFLMMRGLGVSFQSFDGLNSRIAAFSQYKELRDYAGTLDLGTMRIHNRFISDFDLTAGSSMSGDRHRKSSTIRYLGAGIDFGFDLVSDYRILLYPLVGLGLQGYQARFFKDNSNVPFNDVLQSPPAQNDIRSVNFTNDFITYRFGLGFGLRSPKHPASSIGIRAGYSGSFNERSWKSSEHQILAGAPVDNLSQFNISLVFNDQMRHMGRHGM